MEVSERRLDIIQLRTICRALGTTLPDVVARLEEKLNRSRDQQGCGFQTGLWSARLPEWSTALDIDDPPLNFQ